MGPCWLLMTTNNIVGQIKMKSRVPLPNYFLLDLSDDHFLDLMLIEWTKLVRGISILQNQVLCQVCLHIQEMCFVVSVQYIYDNCSILIWYTANSTINCITKKAFAFFLKGSFKDPDTPSQFWPSMGVDMPYSDWCVPHRRVFSAVTTPFRPKAVGKINHSDWLFS